MKDDFEDKLRDQMEKMEELEKKLDEIDDEGSYDDEEEDEESDQDLGSELGDTLDVNDLNNDVLKKSRDSENPGKIKRGESIREGGENSSGISSDSPSQNNSQPIDTAADQPPNLTTETNNEEEKKELEQRKEMAIANRATGNKTNLQVTSNASDVMSSHAKSKRSKVRGLKKRDYDVSSRNNDTASNMSGFMSRNTKKKRLRGGSDKRLLALIEKNDGYIKELREEFDAFKTQLATDVQVSFIITFFTVILKFPFLS